MRLITTIFITLLFFSCKPTKPVVTPLAPKDTVVVTPPPIDTVIIINDPVDTIIPPPPLPVIPVVELKPFEINADIENETTQDLKDVLKDYKDGREINIKKVSLDQRTGQAFYISANSKEVVLKYTTKQSLENAVYTYLGMLGIHWYGAGENWLVKPTVLNNVNIAGEWKEPTFRNRSAFGTGGLNTAISVDPQYSYSKNWLTFMQRNRYNFDFPQTGHAGMVFYQANKVVLDAHPEWFNSESGKVNGRLKIEIPEVVQLYKDWATPKNITELFTTIGVDPEDGRGNSDDPLPPNGFQGINNWNHADKWWWLANEVAKNFDEESKKIAVSMYAYGDGPYNALAPKFKLRKNVYPIIIPYAFQTAYLHNEMIKVWANTIDGKMGIYDYWNITQWSLGLPQFNMASIKEKLTFWNANKIDGINQETTSAAGPMGHIFWLAGQLEWDLTKNFDSLYTQYLNDCFGKGAAPMRNMYDRWSLNYQGNSDVNFSLKDLKNATDLVEVNSPEWKRINDVKAYVHFMKLMAQRDGTQATDDKIYQYMYSIHNRMLVQTPAFVGQRYLGPAPDAISDHKLTAEEVETNFESDLKELPVEYDLSDFVFDYDKAKFVEPAVESTWNFGIFASAYIIAPFTGKVTLEIGGISDVRASITTEDSVLMKENIIKSDTSTGFLYVLSSDHTWRMKRYTIDVVKGKRYNIVAIGGSSRVTMITDGIILFNSVAADDFSNYYYPARYFYVPKGTKKIAYFDGENQPLNGKGYLVSPSGEFMIREATKAKGIYTVPVREGMDGKIWKAEMGGTGWNFVNLPNVTALQLFSYKE